MKGLLKLFVRSILSPNIAPLYMGLSCLAMIGLARNDHFLLGIAVFIFVTGSLLLLHEGRRLVEQDEAELQASNAGKDLNTK